MTLFLIAAAVAVAIALAFVLMPLFKSSPEARQIQRRLDALAELADDLDDREIRRRRQALEQQKAEAGGESAPASLLIGLFLAVPLATWLLYQAVGEPDGVVRGETQVEQIRAGISDIARQLERDPDNVENWARLGLVYKDLREFSSSEHAFRRALYLDEDNPFVLVELAETLLFQSQRGRLPSESRELLEQAVAIDPASQKALWLLGIGAFQDSNYQQALAWWQQLENQLPAGSVRESVREQMQRARDRLGSGDAAGTELPPGHPPLAAGSDDASPVFLVEVALSPEHAVGLDGSETVFLIARAANGPSAPLAVQRMQVADLPTTIALSDGDAMVDGLNLSTFTEIMLTARVSLSGTAEAQPGDIEGQAGPVNILEAAGTRVLMDTTRAP
ncbi:MAG: hypothetical protein EA370_01210 [Wenzhouxiangella sp.]|nr:MAG: hypothetical protein EA370_01210 [Wenzhouxiangella sp.]